MEDVATQSNSEKGFLATVLDVIISPAEGFASVVKKPRLWLPWALCLVLGAAFTTVWIMNVDPAEFGKAQMVESGQWDKMSPEQRNGALAFQTRNVFAIFSGLFVLVGTPLVFLIIAGVLMFVFRFFYAGEVTFRQWFSLVYHSFAAMSLVTTPLLFLVFFLKGDWNMNPGTALQANLTLLMSRDSVSKGLWVLGQSIDLFSLWGVWLLAVGFGVAVKKKVGSTVWGVAIPWALNVLVKVSWAFFF